MKKRYSLGMEEDIVRHIFDIIGERSRFCIEFGACDGERFSNTRALVNSGWSFLWMDGSDHGNESVHKEFITAENINNLLRKYDVPEEVDFISIDIDGNDYWVWKSMTLKPRVVCIEYNPNFSATERRIMRYDPVYVHENNIDYSASYLPMVELGKKKGYTPIYESDYCNIIFIRNDSLGEGMNFIEFPISHLLDKPVDFLPVQKPTFEENYHLMEAV